MTPGAFWVGRRVFLTGHTGFKGSWLALWLHALGSRVSGYSLAPDTETSLYTQARVGELMASTDNPLIFADEDGTTDVISGGNFHGEPLALALDFAAIATAELASIAERRVELLVNPTMSTGLPPFLAPHSGLDSGFMMVHVTASALVSENKVLAHPASVDSIPTSAGKEDHVSMGSISARKFAKVVEHTRTVLAIEALIASQGIDLRAPRRGGHGVRAAHAAIREVVPSLTEDREPSPDIEAVMKLFESDVLLERVARSTTSLD